MTPLGAGWKLETSLWLGSLRPNACPNLTRSAAADALLGAATPVTSSIVDDDG